MKDLRPFFSYYGGKWSLAKRYPEPGARRVSAEVVYVQGRTRGQREMFMEEM